MTDAVQLITEMSKSSDIAYYLTVAYPLVVTLGLGGGVIAIFWQIIDYFKRKV
jgi:hypothetical protein